MGRVTVTPRELHAVLKFGRVLEKQYPLLKNNDELVKGRSVLHRPLCEHFLIYAW